MSIRITNGYVVYREGTKSTLYGPEHGALSLPSETEARLVSEGVAEYVERPKRKSEKPSENAAPPPVAAEVEEPLFNNAPIDLNELKMSALRELAKEYGLTVPVGTTKAELVAMIEAVSAEDGEDAGEDDPPVLDAEGAVVI